MDGTPFWIRLAEHAESAPDKPALTCGAATRTRAELLDRGRRLADLFARRGVVSGSTVTIALPNSVAFMEAVVATWLLGAIPQPISPKLAPAERDAILDLADPALVVGVAAAEARARPSLESVPEDLSSWSGAELEATVAPNWKIMTSGGSTGRPKLIVANQPALVEKVAGFASQLRFPSGDCALIPAPLTHNAPFVVAVMGLLTGTHTVIMPKFEPSETLRLAQEHGATWLYLVPTMMHRIWRLPPEERDRRDLSSLRVAFHMAAPCPAWLKQAWIDWLGPDVILELYSGTELQAMTVVDGHEWLKHPGSVGRPVFGEIQVRDGDGQPLPAGDIGEVWMRRGPKASSPYRYVGSKAKVSADGWESLGDIGYVDDDGYLYLTDRDSDMIVVGGANVYPAEIEAAIDEYPTVSSSCVIGLPHEDLGSVPHAIVEFASPTTDAELLAHLGERLARYKIPRTIERVDHPLRDDAGKVRRSALRAQRLDREVANK